MRCLLFTDGLMEFIECLAPIAGIGGGRNVDSEEQDRCKFPR